MIDILRVAVAQSAEQLEREPFPFYVLEEGPCAQAIIERIVEVLSDEVPVRLGLDDSLVTQGVGYVGESFSLPYQSTVQPYSLIFQDKFPRRPTYYLLLAFVK